MNTMQSFLAFFYLLDQCYDICKEDDLGMFLGMISPEIWEDGVPPDKAIYDDWKNHIQNITISENNIIKVSLKFLNDYGKELDFIFIKTNKVMDTIVDEKMIFTALSKAKELYESHQYSWK